MLRSISALGAVAILAGCSHYPLPVQRLARAEGDARSAQENGAANVPQAQLHLRLAHEGIATAQGLIADHDYERADYVLIRAQSDAELALAEAREEIARTEARRALDEVAAIRATGTTTTTGAPIPRPDTEKKP